LIGISYQIKKHFVQNRTAAVWNFVANATRRRRRILQEQDSFLRAHRPDEHVRMLMWRLPRERTGPEKGPVLRHTEMTFPV